MDIHIKVIDNITSIKITIHYFMFRHQQHQRRRVSEDNILRLNFPLYPHLVSLEKVERGNHQTIFLI